MDLLGQKLSHFEITGHLGSGGMGEVYRAEDTKLGRQVALKLLPQEVAADAERLSRLGREARVLASLNHPNIAAIYSLESVETVEAVGHFEEGDRVKFLVMELVEGETLADRISSGAVPVEDARALAAQMAEGLDYAHERGVVHRDFKPGNVKVTPEGQIKILDFGLAKALDPIAGAGLGSQDLSVSPTITAPATRAGVILGTAPYMSPEQARGQPVDKRTDVWAFGCVLYEMLTGRRAFTGDTVSDSLVAVLEHAPDWSVLPADLPHAVQLLLGRCLQKDRTRRLRDIGDARLDLEETERRVEKGLVGSEKVPTRPLRALLGGSLAVLAVALLAAVWGWTREGPERPAEKTVSKWAVSLEDPLQLAMGGRTNPLAISADGSQIVFVADRRGTSQLYLRQVGEFESKPIPGTEGARNPFFSPDGKRVGFFAGTKLQTVAIDGGAPRIVLESALDDMGSSWGADGTIIFASYGSGLSRATAVGGDLEVLTSLEYEAGEFQHRWPQILPDGDSVLFTVATDRGSRVGLISLATGERRTLSEISDVSRAVYLPGGYLIYGQARGLRAIRFDPANWTTSGEAVSVLEDVASVPDLGNAFFATSDNGALVFVPGAASGGLELVWVDRQGTESSTVEGKASFMHPRLSPDDSQIAVSVGAEVGLRQIWIYDLGRGTRRLLGGDGSHSAPFWSPDGEQLVFSSNQSGSWDLYISEPGGASGAREFVVREFEQWGGGWDPDGTVFVYYDVHPETGRDIWVLDTAAQESRPYLVTQYNERAPRVSPDGRWLAYISNETGLDEVYVESFPERGRKWTISIEGGTEPVWSDDGRELFYRQGDLMMVVDVSLGAEFSAAKPQPLFEGRFDVGVIGNPDYDVTADGQRFLMIKRSASSAPVKLHVILNWDQELAASFADAG